MAGKSRFDHVKLPGLERIPPFPDRLQIDIERLDKGLAPVIHIVKAAHQQFELEGIPPPLNPFKKSQAEIDLKHFGVVFRRILWKITDCSCQSPIPAVDSSS